MFLLLATAVPVLPRGSVPVAGLAVITSEHSVPSMPPLRESGLARLLMLSTFVSRVLRNIALAIVCNVSIISLGAVARAVT